MEILSIIENPWKMSLLINHWVLTFLISSTGITTLRKLLLDDGKFIMRLKTIVKLLIFVFGVRNGSSLIPSSTLFSYIVVKYGVVLYAENS